MSAAVYLPPDEFGGAKRPNLDLAADYLELKAIFSKEKESFSQDIIDALDFAADSEFSDVDIEIKNREETANGAIGRMASRKRVLNEAYPFDLGERGYVVSFVAKERDLASPKSGISAKPPIRSPFCCPTLIPSRPYSMAPTCIRRMKTYGRSVNGSSILRQRRLLPKSAGLLGRLALLDRIEAVSSINSRKSGAY